jgi:hypothetical protein
MTLNRLIPAVLSLSVVLATALQASAQQTTVPATTGTMSSQDLADRKASLLQTKNVDAWPVKDSVLVVNLSVSECTWLGGTVTFWSSCQTTNMKCVGANGREMCIDTVK